MLSETQELVCPIGLAPGFDLPVCFLRAERPADGRLESSV
jgi:hypothetical protein